MASSRSSEATPICRCRVLYLGSAVPHVTKDGLQGIQEPLRELYPEQGALGARGIDSWLSVWSNGILLENVDENHKKVTRFFPIDTLHYCAAVRYVLVPEKSASNSQPRFLPLDSPFARSPNPNHPPLFACILRRTTGIKVLECHTFICKREMAANALVRCCFHAYADSSYARHIDNGAYNANAYSTLRKEEGSNNSIDKVDGWRKITPMAEGSTLTLDSAVHTSTFNNSLVFNNEYSRSNDDISIYNGDENHKIWAGSTRDISDNEEAIYGEYGNNTLRSSRSSRPRQIVSATPPPPPPSKEEKKQKKEQRRKKMTGGSREEMYPLLNGSVMRGSTLRSNVPHFRQGPPLMMLPATIPHLRRPPMQVPKGPRLYHPVPPPIFIQPGGKKKYPLEEPIYMPSNRPMSPVSSYQPCHFPLEAYLMQQYATMNHNMRKVKKKKSKDEWGTLAERKKEENGKEEPATFNARVYASSKEGKKDDENSPYNTGIYRRKGHMNERAFSYSIRQEHRSRSYGSLANLKFAAVPGTSDYEPTANKEEIKKEREIIQMMEDLELSGDDIERSQVPPSVYQQAQQRNSKVRR